MKFGSLNNEVKIEMRKLQTLDLIKLVLKYSSELQLMLLNLKLLILQIVQNCDINLLSLDRNCAA